MTTMNDDFITAICREPERDDLRLVYADWLEENGDVRAAFIRTQIALHCTCPPLYPMDSKGSRSGPLCSACEMEHYQPEEHMAYRHHERHLLEQHWHPWSGISRATYCANYHDSGALGVEFRRGFVESVAVTLAGWFGTDCRTCDGTGAGASPDVGGCPRCHGTGRIGGIGPHVVRCQPVTRVTLTDCQPMEYTAVLGVLPIRWLQREEPWTWRNRAQLERARYELPKEIFDLLAGKWPGHWHYATTEGAMADLSAAVLRWARAEADRIEGVTT